MLNKSIKLDGVEIIEDVLVLNVTDYSLFKTIACNRDIDENHVRKIRKLIEKKGYLISSFVLVDEDFNIQDGQHRFEACKQLGLPIRTIMIKGLTVEHMKQLNTASRNWGYEDAIKHYAKLGDENYIILDGILKTNRDINITTTLNLMYDKRQTVSEDLTEGTLEVTDKILNKFNNRLTNYKKLVANSNRFNTKISGDDVRSLLKLLDDKSLCKFLVREFKLNPNLKIDLLNKTADEVYDDVDALLG